MSYALQCIGSGCCACFVTATYFLVVAAEQYRICPRLDAEEKNDPCQNPCNEFHGVKLQNLIMASEQLCGERDLVSRTKLVKKPPEFSGL